MVNTCGATLVIWLASFTTALTLRVGPTINKYNKLHYNLDEAEQLFTKYGKEFSKTYKNEGERQMRIHNFVETLKRLNNKNNRPSNSWYELTEYSDWSDAEWNEYNQPHKPASKHDASVNKKVQNASKTVNLLKSNKKQYRHKVNSVPKLNRNSAAQVQNRHSNYLRQQHPETEYRHKFRKPMNMYQVNGVKYVDIGDIYAAKIQQLRTDKEKVEYYKINDAKELFDKFVEEYKRVYKNEKDKVAHYLAFIDTLKVLNQLNNVVGKFWYKITEVADYTYKEWKSLLNID